MSTRSDTCTRGTPGGRPPPTHAGSAVRAKAAGRRVFPRQEVQPQGAGLHDLQQGAHALAELRVHTPGRSMRAHPRRRSGRPGACVSAPVSPGCHCRSSRRSTLGPTLSAPTSCAGAQPADWSQARGSSRPRPLARRHARPPQARSKPLRGSRATPGSPVVPQPVRVLTAERRHGFEKAFGRAVAPLRRPGKRYGEVWPIFPTASLGTAAPFHLERQRRHGVRVHRRAGAELQYPRPHGGGPQLQLRQNRSHQLAGGRRGLRALHGVQHQSAAPGVHQLPRPPREGQLHRAAGGEGRHGAARAAPLDGAAAAGEGIAPRPGRRRAWSPPAAGSGGSASPGRRPRSVCSEPAVRVRTDIRAADTSAGSRGGAGVCPRTGEGGYLLVQSERHREGGLRGGGRPGGRRVALRAARFDLPARRPQARARAGSEAGLSGRSGLCGACRCGASPRRRGGGRVARPPWGAGRATGRCGSPRPEPAVRGGSCAAQSLALRAQLESLICGPTGSFDLRPNLEVSVCGPNLKFCLPRRFCRAGTPTTS